MKICVIGTGYVGLVVGTCLSEMGNNVICVDSDEDKLKMLQSGVIPIFEPGLEELIVENVSEKRLEFTSDIDYAVKNSKICYIAVGTPQGDDGCANLDAVYDVAGKIGKAMNEYKVIVDKSTVPVGTADVVADIIKKNTKFEFDVISNPEFLKQGAAVDDFLRPDRVIIGSDSDRATKIMQELYAPFVRTGNPVILMDVKSAEMTKYASNTFLALKISFANEVANLCEKLGANADMVRKGMCADKRIGSSFLFAGLGYGGSCFPKDVKALIKTAKDNNCTSKIFEAVDFVNQNQRLLFVEKILNYYNGDIKGKTFAVWGLAFKPKTNDMREAPSIDIINKLLSYGAKIQAYDPKAFDSAKKIFKDSIIYAENAYSALNGAGSLLLLTEWNEFRHPDFERIKEELKEPVIFDGRNQYDGKMLNSKGFKYICIGKSYN